MVNHVRRVLLAVAALAMLLAGAAALYASNQDSAAQGGGDYVIAVTETGFNPSYCIIRRPDSFSWINKGSQPHRIVSDATSNGNVPLFDDLLQPGQSSRSYSLNVRSKLTYSDVLNPSLKGTIDAGDSPAVCQELPPTPTPTNTPSVSPTATPTRTATPTMTPAPTPTPDPRRAVMPMIARDDDY